MPSKFGGVPVEQSGSKFGGVPVDQEPANPEPSSFMSVPQPPGLGGPSGQSVNINGHNHPLPVREPSLASKSLDSIATMTRPGIDSKLGGLAGIAKNVGEAALPLAVPAAATAPLATLGAAGAGYGGGKLLRGIGSKLGAGPGTQDALETAGQVAGGAAGAKLAPMAADAIPSMERAGQNFERVSALAKDVPVDVSKFAQPALRARELNANTGAPVPAVLRKALQFSGPTTNPLTYGDARDLASAAGRQSVAEKLATNPQMGAQVKRLAGGLADANQEAADSVGMGDLHKSAMTEYRRAAKLRDFKENAIDAAKSTAGKTALGVLGGGAAGYGVSKLLK